MQGPRKRPNRWALSIILLIVLDIASKGSIHRVTSYWYHTQCWIPYRFFRWVQISMFLVSYRVRFAIRPLTSPIFFCCWWYWTKKSNVFPSVECRNRFFVSILFIVLSVMYRSRFSFDIRYIHHYRLDSSFIGVVVVVRYPISITISCASLPGHVMGYHTACSKRWSIWSVRACGGFLSFFYGCELAGYKPPTTWLVGEVLELLITEARRRLSDFVTFLVW